MGDQHKMKLSLLFVAAAFAQSIPDEERKKGDEANCIQIQPTKCQDCVRLGPKCVRGKLVDVCKKLGYDQKKSSCEKEEPVKCLKLKVSECKDCVRLGPECIKANGEEKACEKLGYDSKKNSCKEDNMCIQMQPTKCEDCI